MSELQKSRKCALIIMDGWGHGKDPDRSAIAKADTPFVDSLYKSCPNAELVTFGEEVGLPEGQMGNSEVGHLNIGAGRIVYQELVRINKCIKEGAFEQNEVVQQLIARAKETGRSIHIMGLLSDGGVHSHINHLLGICKIFQKYGDVKVKIHAFLDGRDTAPNGGKHYIEQLQKVINGTNVKLVSVVGRYYAMDRDKRWERVARAYHLLVNGVGQKVKDLKVGVEEQYKKGITDEFMEPLIIDDYKQEDLVQDGDAVLFFNFRTDRPRQMTQVLSQEDFPDQDMCKLNLYYVTMTEYNKEFKNLHVIFRKEDLKNTIGEVLSDLGKKQVRIAETEKYPHVTFFFNGGREVPFEDEHRIMINSPKVATYDLQPEMSAYGVTDAIIKYIDEEVPDFVCLNYANADMVGHTGVMEAAMKAVTTVDTCVERLVKTLNKHGYYYVIIADHGNADIMVNEDGSPHTAHTTNMVPIFVGGPGIDKEKYTVKGGKLGDVATTILSIMDVEIPEDMSGENLLRHES
jgi:2,3-bisphosphoglycerate-independent phosphoglycerate mutase